jgi:ferredoxin
MCVERAPALFGQREEDGLVQVLQRNPPSNLFQAARDAAAGCPVQAIELKDG